jgi:hypothetical protein
MKLPRRNFLHLAAGAAALPTFSRMAQAQAYPSRPVRVVEKEEATEGTSQLAVTPAMDDGGLSNGRHSSRSDRGTSND